MRGRGEVFPGVEEEEKRPPSPHQFMEQTRALPGERARIYRIICPAGPRSRRQGRGLCAHEIMPDLQGEKRGWMKRLLVYH